VILVDANLLTYAVNQNLPQHKRAISWWKQALSGAATVNTPWRSILAFLCICANPRIFSQLLSPESAIACIDESWNSPLSVRWASLL